MTGQRWQQIKTIIEQAIDLTPEQRKSFLNEACKDDLLLRKEVEALLDYESKAEGFLHTPAINDCVDQDEVATNVLVNNQRKRKFTSMSTDLMGLVIDDKYKIEKKLGQGGMGAVFKATHLGTQRAVAIKVIMPQFMSNLEFIERFKIEAKAMGKLRHPNIVNVTDFGFTKVATDKLAYLVMEFLDGMTLGDLLKSKPKLSLDFVVDIVEQVSLAIDFAHKQGVIHRDLKPDNIWLEPDGRGGYNVKILDFGLSKLLEAKPLGLTSKLLEESTIKASLPLPSAITQAETLINNSLEQIEQEDVSKLQSIDLETLRKISSIDTQEKTLKLQGLTTNGTIDAKTIPEWMTRIGTILGTPLYISPEQCKGADLSTSSDIYSLGVIVYQMLAGETPFTGNMYQLIEKHSSEPAPNVRKICKDIPKEIEELLIALLSKNPKDRPKTASIIASSLRFYQSGDIGIFRKAFDLYRKNIVTFARMSANIYFPILFLFSGLVVLLKINLDSATRPSYFFNIAVGVAYFSFIFFANTINKVAVSIILKELNTNNGVSIKSVFTLLRSKIRLITSSVYKHYKLTISDFLKIRRINLEVLNKYFLALPILVLEDKEKTQVLEKSKNLSKYISSLIFAVKIRSFLIALASIVPLLFGFIFCGWLLDTIATWFFVSISQEYWLVLFTVTTVTFVSLFLSISFPVVSIANFLSYFKACELVGEDKDKLMIRGSYELISESKQKSRITRTLAYTTLSVVLLFSLGFWFFNQSFLLFMAAKTGNTNLANVLIALGADVNAKYDYKDDSGQRFFPDYKGFVAVASPLIIASKYQHLSTVKLLLDKGADVNLKIKGISALSEALENENYPIADLLLAKGADINDIVNNNAQLAVKNIYMLDKLLKRGIDINTRVSSDGQSKTIQGMTLLMYAVSYNYPDGSELLIKNGADVNAKNNTGGTALDYAALYGNTTSLRQLIEAGADVNTKNSGGTSALIQVVRSSTPAAYFKATDCIKVLIEAGIDVNLQDNNGSTALMYAVKEGKLGAIKTLLLFGAKVNIVDNNGKNALMYLSKFNIPARTYNEIFNIKYNDIVNTLVSAGIDINHKDNSGSTALTYANKNGFEELSNALKANGANQ